MNNVSKAFFFGSYLAASLVGTTFTLLAAIMEARGSLEGAVPFGVLGAPFGIYTVAVFVILIYKMWRALPVTIARTTPARAAGFFFIPLFNLYWAFVMMWGWSKDWNSYAEEPGEGVARVPEGLFLSIPIVLVVQTIAAWVLALLDVPYMFLTSFLLSIPVLVLYPIAIFIICDRLNAAPAPEPSQGKGDGFGVASLVCGIYSIVGFCLGPVLGIAAVLLAAKQRTAYREPLSTAGLIMGMIGIVLWCGAGLIVALIMTTL